MCIPYTQRRLYEITEHSDASRQPSCFFFFFFFLSHVPGCQAKMANWLCFSETLIFTQLTKSLWHLRVLHARCWVRQTSSLTRQQMHSFWKQSAFILFFFPLSRKYPVRPLPITNQSLESICKILTYIWNLVVLLVLNSVCLCDGWLPRCCLGKVKDGQAASSRDSYSCLGEKIN